MGLRSRVWKPRLAMVCPFIHLTFTCCVDVLLCERPFVIFYFYNYVVVQESLTHNCTTGANQSCLEFSWMLVRAAEMALSPLLWSCQTGPQKGFQSLLPFTGTCPALSLPKAVHCRMGRMEHSTVHPALAFMRMTSCLVHKSLPKAKTTAAGNCNSETTRKLPE